MNDTGLASKAATSMAESPLIFFPKFIPLTPLKLSTLTLPHTDLAEGKNGGLDKGRGVLQTNTPL